MGLDVVLGTVSMVGMHAGMMHAVFSCGNAMNLHLRRSHVTQDPADTR
jgi:hypothetical protein